MSFGPKTSKLNSRLLVALRNIIYSLTTLIISAYPEGAPGRGGSDGCCCSCLPGPNRTHEPQYWPRTTPPYPYVPGQKRGRRPTKHPKRQVNFISDNLVLVRF